MTLYIAAILGFLCGVAALSMPLLRTWVRSHRMKKLCEFTLVETARAYNDIVHVLESENPDGAKPDSTVGKALHDFRVVHYAIFKTLCSYSNIDWHIQHSNKPPTQ
jgi:hypothetical protein